MKNYNGYQLICEAINLKRLGRATLHPGIGATSWGSVSYMAAYQMYDQRLEYLKNKLKKIKSSQQKNIIKKQIKKWKN